MVSKQTTAPIFDEEESGDAEETEDEIQEAELEYENETEQSYIKNKIDPEMWPFHILNSEEHRFLFASLWPASILFRNNADCIYQY